MNIVNNILLTNLILNKNSLFLYLYDFYIKFPLYSLIYFYYKCEWYLANMLFDNDYLIFELEKTVENCQRCILSRHRNNIVFGGGGKTGVPVMFIGEAPGHDEDIQGKPFVGRSGKLLMRLVKEIMGYEREDIYITNIVKCRPPENRNPELQEVNACLPYLVEQIKMVNPKIIVLLGAVAIEYLLNKTGITTNRGNFFKYDGFTVVPTFHPSYLLRFPEQEKYFIQDMIKIKNFLVSCTL